MSARGWSLRGCAWRCIEQILPMLLVACALLGRAPAVSAMRMTRIHFDASASSPSSARMHVTFQRTDADGDASYVACSSTRCQMVPMPGPNDSIAVLQWRLQADGHVLRVVDASMRTVDWVAWGFPRHTEPRDILEANVRTYKCDQVWQQIPQARGLARSGDAADDAWEWIPAPTMERCLATAAPALFHDDRSTAEVAADTLPIVMHLRVLANGKRLAFTRWISRGLPCDVPASSFADEFPSEGDDDDEAAKFNALNVTYMDPEITDWSDSYWMYERNRDESTCTTSQFKQQVATTLKCLTLQLLLPSSDRHGWKLPLRDTHDASLPWSLQSTLAEWREAFATTPLFLCKRRNPKSDVTYLHSILLLFTVPSSSAHSPLRLQLNQTDSSTAQRILDELALPDTVDLCPAYFHA